MNVTPRPFTVSASRIRGLPGASSELAQRRLQCGKIMSVAARRLPAKRSKFAFQLSQIADIPYPGVRLDLVMINDDGQAIEAIVGSAGEGFPKLSFLQFPVACENKNPSGLSKQAAGFEHAFRLRDSHSERSRVCVAIRGVDIRVARQPAETAKLMKQGKLQKPQTDQRGIEAGGVVPLRRKVHVPEFSGRVLFHFLEEEPGDDIQAAETAADMP